MIKRSSAFWAIQGPGWLLVFYLVYAQAIPAFDYELGVAMGTQESVDMITEVGTAFFYGFAFSDLVSYIPLLISGLVGHWFGRRWSRVILGAALGITVYWPMVSLATVVAARDAPGWSLPNERDFWIVLPLITLWAILGLWWLVRWHDTEAAWFAYRVFQDRPWSNRPNDRHSPSLGVL